MIILNPCLPLETGKQVPVIIRQKKLAGISNNNHRTANIPSSAVPEIKKSVILFMIHQKMIKISSCEGYPSLPASSALLPDPLPSPG
ncbi:MAG: hypothetical protein K6G81_02220, partial [Lachnospiraceae bacterium]|nr:hypothetical protein [Lachnospiraceae bacterium]